MHVVFFNRVRPVPQRESARDDQADEYADQEKPPVGGKHDHQDRHDENRDD